MKRFIFAIAATLCAPARAALKELRVSMTSTFIAGGNRSAPADSLAKRFEDAAVAQRLRDDVVSGVGATPLGGWTVEVVRKSSEYEKSVVVASDEDGAAVAGDADGLLLAVQEHAPVVARRSGAAERLVGRGQSIIADDDAAFGRAAMRLATRKDARRASVVAARANADALFGGGDSDDLRAFLAAVAGRHPRAAARAAAAFRRRAALVLAAAFAASLAAALALRALRPRDDASARHRRRAKGRLW